MRGLGEGEGLTYAELLTIEIINIHYKYWFSKTTHFIPIIVAH